MQEQSYASKMYEKTRSKGGRSTKRTARKTPTTAPQQTKCSVPTNEIPEMKGVQLKVVQTKDEQAKGFKLEELEKRKISRGTSSSKNLESSNLKTTPTNLVQKQNNSIPPKTRNGSTPKFIRSTQNSARKNTNVNTSTTVQPFREKHLTSKISKTKQDLKDTKLKGFQIDSKDIQPEKIADKEIKPKEGSKDTQEKRSRVRDKQAKAKMVGLGETHEKHLQRKEERVTRTPIKEEQIEMRLYEDHCDEMEVDVEETAFKEVKINLKRCIYKVVENVAASLGMEVTRDDDDESWDVYWSDYSITTVKSKTMTLRQRINHFPGMANLESKAFLAYHLNRMRLEFPLDYNFFPGSWSLPYQNHNCMIYVENHPKEVYILKPSRGAEGKGIKVFSNVEDIKTNTEEAVCQMYISKLLLLDSYKFDLRVYVLITCIDPLQIFVYNNGLVRLATCPYAAPNASNMNNQFMHLTNYSINKASSNYDPSDEGSKRDFTAFNRWLTSKLLDKDKLWKDIDDVIIKTLIAIHPILKEKYEQLFPTHYKHNVTACFEILGFDIIIGDGMKPYLLEVNRSPSFNILGDVDERVKRNLIEDTFRLLNLQSEFTSRNQANLMGNYRKIYPTARSYEYSKFVHFIFTVPHTSEDKKGRKQME